MLMDAGHPTISPLSRQCLNFLCKSYLPLLNIGAYISSCMYITAAYCQLPTFIVFFYSSFITFIAKYILDTKHVIQLLITNVWDREFALFCKKCKF